MSEDRQRKRQGERNGKAALAKGNGQPHDPTREVGVLCKHSVVNKLAERGGFEPPVRLLTVQRFSKPPPSATRPSLQLQCESTNALTPRQMEKFQQAANGIASYSSRGLSVH